MRLSRRGALVFGLVLFLSWGVLALLTLRVGRTGAIGPADAWRGALGWAGIGRGLEGNAQAILELRLLRAFASLAVGAALALAGAYLQGLFRNGLASPSVVGVTAGSVFGASLAIAWVGGFGAEFVPRGTGLGAPFLITLCAFLGAALTTFAVASIATVGGRLSVPTLLLAGVAMNTLIAGWIAALQSLTLSNVDVSRAVLAWTFGTLQDRSVWQVALLWIGLGASVLAIPFVALELDLLAGGEEDAAALGVDVPRVKVFVLLAASLATALAVSIAGQIAFLGLVVPHVVRMFVGPGHRRVLPLSVLFGGTFLLGCDLGQRALLGDAFLRPGVVLSILGGPFFLALLLKNRRALTTW
jgi:iron complex transport system permease protein